MIVLALVIVVLIQRSEGGGLGIGGGSGFMSARGAANALTRTTAILAALFFVTSLAMGILARYDKPTSILDRIPATQGSGNGVLDSLGGDAPAAPATGTDTVPTEGGAATNSGTATPPASGSDVPSGQ